MADVNTAIYQPLQAPQQQQLGPLQILQMISSLNQAKLFEQEFQARQNIGEAYRQNTLPNGEINAPGLRTQIGQTGGFHAGEGLSQATANSAADAGLKSTYQQILRQTFGALSSKPVITDQDISAAKADAARQGVPGAFIQDYLADMPRARSTKEQGARKEWAVTQSNLARGPEAIAGGTAGPVDEGGVRPDISQGEAAYRRAGVNPEAPVATQPGQTGMRTELPAGAKTRLEAGGPMMAAALARAGTYGADIFPMEQALSALQKLGPTGTGAGKDEINTIKNFVQANLSWLPGAEKISGNPEDIKNFDEAKKYLTNIAGARAGAFGHGTDQALSTALTASPNTHISNLAAVDLTKATIALRRMEQVQTLEADSQGIAEYKYPGWAAKWATTVDPRAFMIDKMDKKQLEGVEKTLDTPEKRRRFNMSVKKAVDSGVLELPQ